MLIFSQITDTVLNVVMDRMVTYGNILLYPDEDASTFSPEEAWARSHGSKLCIVVEQMQIATVWLTKACILIIYARVTGMLSQYKLVIATAIYVGITWVSNTPHPLVCSFDWRSDSILGCDGNPVFRGLVPALP